MVAMQKGYWGFWDVAMSFRRATVTHTLASSRGKSSSVKAAKGEEETARFGFKGTKTTVRRGAAASSISQALKEVDGNNGRSPEKSTPLKRKYHTVTDIMGNASAEKSKGE
uniref:Uncharacterized protein n=1 Tax=Palpitomonas bilix TaxID=652834 RepID=A0A7S3GD09_9EUKA|mmetsp:Transcript_44079/g.114712  ORF Transcript_44079/g.114712 Transcript_44079/m.114712 type:complete len:111 (+) Transcript_44079:148-480(+)